jgi:membrane-associated phospholipid phosphatase
MRTVEWIVVAYLAYVVVLAWLWPMRQRVRVIATLVAAADAALIAWLSARTSTAALVARDWLPAAHILIGYRLSGPFFHAPMAPAEGWLVASDRWWFEVAGLRWFADRGPRVLLELLELAYTSAYVMVPLGFAIVHWAATPVDADRYWTAVVSAELVCYAMLPWLRARTPDALGDHVTIDDRAVTLRRLNRALQHHGSIRVTTIPSGHAAGALATALMAGAFVPAALVPLLILALAIALGSVVGRYHYAIDALLGFAVGAIAVALT